MLLITTMLKIKPSGNCALLTAFKEEKKRFCVIHFYFFVIFFYDSFSCFVHVVPVSYLYHKLSGVKWSVILLTNFPNISVNMENSYRIKRKYCIRKSLCIRKLDWSPRQIKTKHSKNKYLGMPGTLLKNPNTIKQIAAVYLSKRMKVKPPKYDAIKRKLFDWYTRVRALKISLNGQ